MKKIAYIHYKPEFMPEEVRHYNYPTQEEFEKYSRVVYEKDLRGEPKSEKMAFTTRFRRK